MALNMKEKFATVDMSKLPANVKSEFELIKESTENFDPDLVPVFQDNFNILYGVVEKKHPEALKTGGKIKKVRPAKVKKVKGPTSAVLIHDARGVFGDGKIPEKIGMDHKRRGLKLKVGDTVYYIEKDSEYFDPKYPKWKVTTVDKKDSKRIIIENEKHGSIATTKSTVSKKRPKFEMTHKSRGKSDSHGDIDDCRKILTEAGYTTKKRLPKSGTRAMKVKEPRQERTIIKDKVEGVFTTIEKDISGSKEKDEKYKAMQAEMSEIRAIVVKLLTLLNNLAEDNSLAQVKKINSLLKKIVP
jgi:hypothetical protein